MLEKFWGWPCHACRKEFFCNMYTAKILQIARKIRQPQTFFHLKCFTIYGIVFYFPAVTVDSL